MKTTKLSSKVQSGLTVILVISLWPPLWGASGDIQMEGKDCLSSGCHAELISEKTVHGPVAQGKCTPCHEQSDPSIHLFRPVSASEQLCNSCHIMPMKNFIHQPVREGKCTDCHDPHQSNYRFMLKSDPTQDLCLNCHETDSFMESQYIHAPVVAGACILCHEPHSAWHPNLLIQSGRDLCVSCHDQVERRLTEARHVHEAVKGDCTECHNPHGSKTKMFLVEKQKDLCFSCHVEMKTLIQNSEHVHGAVTGEDSCTQCHFSHVSVLPALLKKPLMDSCLACHNKPITTPDGRQLTDMATLLKNNPDHHGPVRRADCSACHNPHASVNFNLLKEEYPEMFYAPFDLGNYNLCFQCHIKEMVTVERGQGLTRFKHGDLNLHFVHVNKEQKGRTCRACHEVHASKHPFHIRSSVPFGTGGWEYEIKFEKTPTGGTCASGCHVPREYIRSPEDTFTPRTLDPNTPEESKTRE